MAIDGAFVMGISRTVLGAIVLVLLGACADHAPPNDELSAAFEGTLGPSLAVTAFEVVERRPSSDGVLLRFRSTVTANEALYRYDTSRVEDIADLRTFLASYTFEDPDLERFREHIVPQEVTTLTEVLGAGGTRDVLGTIVGTEINDDWTYEVTETSSSELQEARLFEQPQGHGSRTYPVLYSSTEGPQAYVERLVDYVQKGRAERLRTVRERFSTWQTDSTLYQGVMLGGEIGRQPVAIQFSWPSPGEDLVNADVLVGGKHQGQFSGVLNSLPNSSFRLVLESAEGLEPVLPGAPAPGVLRFDAIYSDAMLQGQWLHNADEKSDRYTITFQLRPIDVQ
ncbi:MAG: hypothetical protein AAFX52_11390 [Pseudomonadota bacterium]